MKLRSNRVLQRGRCGIENEDLTIMKLRSNRVLKRAKPDIENEDITDNLSNGENGASEGEIEVCAADADENVEMGMNDGVNVNVDDKGVFLGSEVLDPVKYSVVSCPKQETEENESLDVENEEIEIEKGEHLDRRAQKQLIREKIYDMLLKSGWTIELRRRQNEIYLDAMYVEPNRKRTHWSTTKAYAMLKKKIEEGDANDNEISAYYPIPEEEISMLFRTKKKLGDEKRVNKGKIISNKKKKVFKITKNGSKKKLGKKTSERSKPHLLARGSEKGSQKDNNGGLVTKNRNLLSFMIDSGVILVGSKVQYGETRKKKKSYEGTITSDGICCGCCNEVMGISEFVSHFGGNTSQGFDNVYLESGMCLRKCLVDSWRREEELNSLRFDVVVDVKGDDPNDDACNICGDGGDLICCDSCPSTFHQSCLDIQNFPSGDWNCNYCSCKFCGVLSVTIPQVDDSHDAVTSEMLSCCLCEDKFHLSCLPDVEDVNIESNGRSFCGKKCLELFKQLQMYLGVKHELEDGFSWTLLQRSDIDQDLAVHDAQLKVEHNSKLAVAFCVMDECFLPINDKRSGTNIIHNVVYNCSSNFKRLNYSSFVTAVLEKGDEVITVASIRVHGYRLAEMPFIGTRQMYRRQGMCRRLLDAIESCLSSIGVEELIIPTIPELLQTWTKVFGFMPPEESLKQAMKCVSMIVIPGIDMLKKSLFQNRAFNANSSPSTASDENIVECNNKQHDENVTQLEIMSSKERAGKDVIDREQTREDVVENEQSEEPMVKKDVIESAEYNKKPTSPHPFLDTLEDLPPRTSNPPHLPTFDSIEHVARQPSRASFDPDHMDVDLQQFEQTFQELDASLWIDAQQTPNHAPPPQPPTFLAPPPPTTLHHQSNSYFAHYCEHLGKMSLIVSKQEKCYR